MRARMLTRGLRVDRWSRFGPTRNLTDSDYKTKKADTRSTAEGKEMLTWTHGRRKARPWDRSRHNLICVSPTSQFTPNNYHTMILLINTGRYDAQRYAVNTVTPICSFLFDFTPARQEGSASGKTYPGEEQAGRNMKLEVIDYLSTAGGPKSKPSTAESQ